MNIYIFEYADRPFTDILHSILHIKKNAYAYFWRGMFSQTTQNTIKKYCLTVWKISRIVSIRYMVDKSLYMLVTIQAPLLPSPKHNDMEMFPHYWPPVRRNHQSPVVCLTKGQSCKASILNKQSIRQWFETPWRLFDVTLMSTYYHKLDR